MFREIVIDNVMYPVIVNHSHLNSGDRVDQRNKRVDTLLLTITIQYEHLPVEKKSLKGCFSWASLYKKIAEAEVPTITTPLEFLLDEWVGAVERLASEQSIKLYHVDVKAKRIGLITGSVDLQVNKQCNPLPCSINKQSEFRSAGVFDVPLSVVLDRTWLHEDVAIGEERHTHETVYVSFQLRTARLTLSDGDLRGLFSYASAYEIINSKQGVVLSSLMENLIDEIWVIIENSARDQGLTISSGRVTVTRANYPRVTPSFSLVIQ